MNRRRRNKAEEITRNLFFIAVAVLVVVVFFNLDIINKGESLFNRTAAADIKFSGDLGDKDYAEREIDRLRGYLKGRKKLIGEITIRTATEDSYRKVTPDTEILFEIRVVMRDGFTFTTPLRRSLRKNLPKSVLTKLDKDVRAYQTLKKEGKNPKTLINTM
ncbi:MAG: hypothetical protein H0S80_15000 [Desulfovibrionaceae bacterium]|nr:hypothetical protein [Desulfovibrionaceae bacterium]